MHKILCTAWVVVIQSMFFCVVKHKKCVFFKKNALFSKKMLKKFAYMKKKQYLCTEFKNKHKIKAL